jgi:hypothetical protein
VTPPNSEELVGGNAAQPVHSDAIAARVLVKGEPVPAPPGRADDFAWPLGSDAKAAPPVASAPAADAVARAEPPASAGKPSDDRKRGATGKTSQTTGSKQRIEHPEIKSRTRHEAPRPPAPIRPSNSPFGWLR